jgi:type I restriction enzyme S subunit
VLLSITADLGRTAVVPEGLARGFINQHLAILRTNSVRPRFLSAYLSSPDGQRQIFRLDRNAVKAGLNFDDVRGLVIPLPPDALQRRYEALVAAAEHVRATAVRASGLADELFASLQDRAFIGEL